MILNKLKNWDPSSDWIKINTLDTHTAGEPLRIILDGYPKLDGKTVLEKIQYFRTNYDYLRKTIMSEPRGHNDMYGAILVEPNSKQSDFGVMFLHNKGYSTGCGHAIIAITKVLFEIEAFNLEDSKKYINIDVPSGRIKAWPNIKKNRIDGVSFINVPSFVYKLDCQIYIEGLGHVKYDIAYGGAFYVVVESKDVGLKCDASYKAELIKIGMEIKSYVENSHKIINPITKEKESLYGTIFIDKAKSATNHSRNVCVFANGQIDRSPTGTGVSARAALHYARGEIKIGEDLIVESIIGSIFKVSIQKEKKIGSIITIVPKVTGNAYIIGRNTYYIDPKDPFRNGFLV